MQGHPRSIVALTVVVSGVTLLGGQSSHTTQFELVPGCGDTGGGG